MKVVDANAYIPRTYDNNSTAQVLELWSRGYRPDITPPPYYGQRDNGCHEWEKMPIFMAFLSA
jgi:hypothetical protein